MHRRPTREPVRSSHRRCTRLSNLLGQIASPDDIEQAFKAYDAVRRPRTLKVVLTSRETARIYEIDDEEIRFDLNKAGEFLETCYDWIRYGDLTEQLRKAQAAIGGRV
jgi:salicylate hydroxylase